MVKHKGLCPSLKRSVEFDVNEIIELKTKRGTKYQVKGDYEGRTCSTFCSKEKAMELKSALGQTTMSAETEDGTGQAHQDESVAPMDNNVQPLSQGQEPMEDMPIQETVATPITGTSVGVEAIDNLQLNDADALANMATQFDEAPDMVADFEIAPQEPEGDGRSIGNIRPMNEDVPLHAESEDGTGQAHQEEGVAPIETDVQPLAEGQEPMEDMPIQETVATPITNSSVGVEAIDNLQLNDADALANMATQFDEAPEMLADFEISFMQPFGDGQSIGNNTPMNPDVPLHAETFESPIQTVNPMDETTLTTPPPVCFVEKIPPVVWENMSVLEQIEYAETGNESLLSCPQCGITKAELRDAGGYCAVSDPEGSEYISSVDCPYQKHFAPSHWLDEEYVVGHVEGDIVEVSERLPAEVDMPKMKNPQKGLETMVVPYFVWDKIYSQFNGGITAEPDLSGLNYTLQFHGMMKPQIKNLIEVAEGDHDIMFGSETYTATVLKAEKDRGYFIDSATVRPYEAETFEAEQCKHESYYRVRHNNDDWESDGERFCTTIIKCSDCGVEGKGRTNLSHEETPDRRYTQLWWEDIGYEAETKKDCCRMKRLVERKDGTARCRNCGTVEFWKAEETNCSSCGEMKVSPLGDLVPPSCVNPKCPDYVVEESEWWGSAETFEADTRKYLGVWVNKQGDKHYYLYSDDDDYVFGELRYEPNWKAKGWEHPYWDLDVRGGKSLFVKSFNEGVKAFRRETMNAEEFNVEFDDWADQEMLTHGKDVSFKEWAKEEGKKHGDMDLTDWAEEEEESHDERYGAEDYQKKMYQDFLDNWDDEWEGSPPTFKEWKDLVKDVVEVVEYEEESHDERYGAETFNAELEDCYVCDGMFKQVYVCDNDCGFQCCEVDIDGNLIPVENADGTVKDYCITCYEEKYEAETFESPATKDKPSLKSVGLLLGVGALATYLAPKSMRDFLNRLK